MLYPVFFAAVYFSHLTLLRLPYFWDEGGYYIPAAWDFFNTGTLIPFSTLSNAHPPLPAILLAGWWRLSGFVPSGTRTFLCMVTAGALLAVYRLAHHLLGPPAAVAATLLTAIYPIWFAQSTLDHGDLFAAAFTLWGLAFYLESVSTPDAADSKLSPWPKIFAALFFSLAALSKETGVITPVALALWEAFLALRDRILRRRAGWIAALLIPFLPLAAWYLYHRHRTGYAFGNPDFLRYNATANLDPHRVALGLYHRFLQLTLHMNMFVPVTCALAVLLMPAIAGRMRLSRPVLNAIAVVLLVNWVAFSVLGGALLTRYLLALYPLVLLVCVAEWQRHLRRWQWLAALSAAAFLAGIWINPPYAFAPEDNLTYRDMVVLHQRAINLIAQQWPQATVLTAWPVNNELQQPFLGYTRHPIKAFWIQNFSIQELEKAASEPGDYDLALLFSTKWNPPPGGLNLAPPNPVDARYFDFHQDASPAQAAQILHGDLVWQASRHGEWVAILRFPRIENASLHTR
ncbi:MAG: glycosyltransferase family 39 protein [Acidobacteriaceae bacterium]|jgi:4-amino-4-deoxy-L-arabinose transferase-like glycosyltransferase